MSQEYIKALQQNDRKILERARQAPRELPKDIDRAVAGFDEEARQLSIEFVAMQDSEYSGRYLLRRANDPSPDVASLAIEKMNSVIHKPKVDDIIATIPSVQDPYIRGELYLGIGERKENDLLGKLRPVAANEKDAEAKLKATAALVKLGGKPEKAEFIEIIRNTVPDDALTMQDHLLYVNNPDLAKGLLPWLDNTEDVMRLGGDRQEMMARMNDVGVWTARMLKIKLPFETTKLRNFTQEEIEQTKRILLLLP